MSDHETRDGAIPPASPTVSIDGNKPNYRRQLGALVFLALALGATALLAMVLFKKKNTDTTQTTGEMKNALNPKTFQLPETPPPKPAPPPVPQAAPAPPPEAPPLPAQAQAPVKAQPIILDKSQSDLMVPVQNTNASAAQQPPVSAPDTPQQGLGGMLQSTATPARAAALIGNRNFILPKGAFINCSLNTALNSTVAGMTSCTVTNDVFSDNGKFVLIERGSTITGEYQTTLHRGDDRLFVLWNRVKTANGIVVSLDSPATDGLGTAGVSGYVDDHFFERFGAAILLSVIQTGEQIGRSAVQNVTQKRGTNNQSTNMNVSTGSADSIVNEALKANINIPPTLSKNQGETVGIFVARDLDFSTVYSAKTSKWSIPR